MAGSQYQLGMTVIDKKTSQEEQEVEKHSAWGREGSVGLGLHIRKKDYSPTKDYGKPLFFVATEYEKKGELV